MVRFPNAACLVKLRFGVAIYHVILFLSTIIKLQFYNTICQDRAVVVTAKHRDSKSNPMSIVSWETVNERPKSLHAEFTIIVQIERERGEERTEWRKQMTVQ
jgi:hypothetical protein